MLLMVLAVLGGRSRIGERRATTFDPTLAPNAGPVGHLGPSGLVKAPRASKALERAPARVGPTLRA
jgi:hypothetical protein